MEVLHIFRKLVSTYKPIDCHKEENRSTGKVENECPVKHYHMRENRILLCRVRLADEETGELDICRRSTRNCTEPGVWKPKPEDEPTGT